MEIERNLAEYISSAKFDDLPKQPLDVIKNVLLTVIGTTVAGASEEGCVEVVNQVREWGGREEATILVYGGKTPSYNAVLANSTMARALDICDSTYPGIHIGSSSIPTALAVAELTGGCSGRDFLTALVVGTEVASRINAISVYDGFDPTGVCSIFATAAIAGKILHLNSEQMLNNLALAFNRAGGSFQSNIDGSLAVRLIQAFVSQGGIICAQLAKRGITGPKNFIEGIYGYFHLYAKDIRNEKALVGELGDRFEMTKTVFKSYPSCGATISSTDAILSIVKEHKLNPEDVVAIDVGMAPYMFRLVGHHFEIGDNPRVNAQFNVHYCVANGLLNKASRLPHFKEDAVRNPRIMDIIKKIHVAPDPTLEDPAKPGFSAGARLKVKTRRGSVFQKDVIAPSGFPENPMSNEALMERFHDYVNFGGRPLSKKNIEAIPSIIAKLEDVQDVRNLISLLISDDQ